MHSQAQGSSERIPMWTEWGISVLNGIIGDYLRERRNALAIEMAFYHHNRPLPLNAESLLIAHPNPTAKLCVLLHGLGCNEGIWAFRDTAQCYPDTSYGTLLQQELGYTPFYVRYNTGLSILENGKALAALLDGLLARYPVSVEDIVLIGHSMGGLVLRSACHHGTQRQHAWVNKIRQAFYLGTPHDGADLERLGHVAVTVLQAVPNPVTRLIGTILNLRSRGVKDLQFGYRIDENWLDDFPDAGWHNQRKVVPWLANAHHYLIVGTLTEDPRHPATRLLGDALVKLPCTQGEGSTPLPEENIKLFPRIHHLRLAHDPSVYQQIRWWCKGE
jgi:pimeloyl-ACP methyl ester carboxylesterase